MRAFTKTAVEFAGPFVTMQDRGKRREKRYLCLFTCMVTRAVHLELAYGLDTDSFMNAFYRMASRRGLPNEIYSDNGTNFKGAENELKALVTQLDEDKIKQTYQTANPSDDVPLTPNHFVHGQVGGQFAPTLVDETDFNPRSRWRRIQELVRHFWQGWLREWLPELIARKKWFHPGGDLRVGDVVIVMSPDTTRGNWPLGMVFETYPGTDGRVRVVKIQVGRQP